MPGAELRSALRLLRKGITLVLLIFFCGIVTAFAFSSVAHKNWHSRLVKGEYTPVAVDEMSVDETAVEDETPPNVYVIVSEPVQIFVDTPEEAADGEIIDEEPEAPEEPIEEPNDTIAVENTDEITEPEETIIAAPDENESIENITAGSGEEIGE